MEVLVFKTNVSESEQVSKVQTLLTPIRAIEAWNFDLEDCDNILRVVAKNLPPRYIETILQTAGIVCEELAY
jgi:hypothetical protein